MENSETKVDGEVSSGTIFDFFRKAVVQHSGKVALMYKTSDDKYKGITYQELYDSVNQVARAIKNSGIKKGDKVAICSYNRPEWAITDLALQKLGAVVVPLYHTLTCPAMEYMINDSESRLIFVENAELFAKIDSLRNRTASVFAMIVFDDRGIDAKKDFLKFSDLKKNAIELGEDIKEEYGAVSKDDDATIVYTSGTTGEPKGVVLSHHNIVSNVVSSLNRLKITPKDRFFSFLPLCHMFERTCGYYTPLFSGASIGYAKNLSTIAEDIRKIHPTMLLVVPGVIEKAYDKVVKEVQRSSPIKRKLVNSAIRILNEYVNLRYKKIPIPFGLKIRVRIYNIFVASKFRKIGGGRLRAVISGGAPLNGQIAKLFHILGFNIMEGYGLTELAPVACVNLIEDVRLGTVGKPLDGVEIKIGANEEILVRGANLMKGYFKKPEETAKVIDKEGWFHTGDQGKFDQDGNLIICGRIKEIIVTSNGKKIAPSPIEAEINSSIYISQTMLYGDNRKHISALIIPEKEFIESYAKERNIPFVKYDDLLENDEVKKLIATEIEKTNVNLSPYEKVKAFTLLTEGFTTENGMLTPTLKLRRNMIIEKYKNRIELVYAQS
jgi:long-chain acyl-CoA synthetase